MSVASELAPEEVSGSDGGELTRPPADLEVAVIVPPSGWVGLNVRELWAYRDLAFLLVRRDIAARYRQSVAGYGWAVIKPVLSMLIFTFVFGRVARIETGDLPYPLFAFSGLLPWLYFAGALNSATTSVVSGSGLVSKVYFPRLLLPLAATAVGLVELSVQLVVLAGLVVWYGVVPGWHLLFAPLFLTATMVLALAGGLWLTALNVKYRDVGMVVPFLTQLWMWVSPVAYPTNLVPEQLRVLYGLNPLVGILEGFRWSVLGSGTPEWRIMAVSMFVMVVILIGGLFFFRRVEATFADVI